MRTNEERLAAMHRRAAELEQENRHSRVRILKTASFTAAFLLVIGLAWIMPGAAEALSLPEAEENMRASIFTDTRVITFIVIGVVSFMLGVSVTVFCFRLKKWQDKKDAEQDRTQ